MGTCFSVLKRQLPTVRSGTSALSHQEEHELSPPTAESTAQSAGESRSTGRPQEIGASEVADPTHDTNTTSLVIPSLICDSHQSQGPGSLVQCNDPAQIAESGLNSNNTPSGNAHPSSNHPTGSSDATQDQHIGAPISASSDQPSSLERSAMTSSGTLLGSPTPDLKTSVKDTSWSVLKDVLKTAKDSCDGIPVPGLKAALSVAVAAMEKADDVNDAHSGFQKIASKVEGLSAIVRRYAGTSEMPRFILDRLNGIATELQRVVGFIENKEEQRGLRRTIEASNDNDNIKTIFRHLGSVIEMLQTDCNLYMVHEAERNAAEAMLDKLQAVPGASIDAQDSTRACMDGTREPLLEDLDNWAHNPSSSRVFWLNGMAGTGKSAIARSLCYSLHQSDKLAGSFFCSRGTVRDDVKRILPTLAVSLARHSPAYKSALVNVLKEHPEAGHDNLELQVQRLIEEPLRKAFPHNPDPTMVLVIDALDECSDKAATGRILNRLLSISAAIPIKFFLTSRPEAIIRATFWSKPDAHRVLRLHEIGKDDVQADISRYLTHRLEEVRRVNITVDYPDEWPSRADMETVASRAGLLFIYAFTAIQYIEEDPVERLKDLTQPHGTEDELVYGNIDKMYHLVLTQATNRETYKVEEIKKTMEILAAILTFREPQTLTSLAIVIDMPPERVRKRLDALHAVIQVPSDNDTGVVSSFHASFRDYMTTSTRSKEYYIDPCTGHHDLAGRCMTIMDDMLHFNMSQGQTSYLDNTDMAFPAISGPLLYACLYWSHHLCSASHPEQKANEMPLALCKTVEDVLSRKFLFWLEVLSMTQNVHLASGLLRNALTASIVKMHGKLMEFLREANQFVASCREAIETSAPHIYISALPSISEVSLIAKMYWPEFRNTAAFHARGIGRDRNTLLNIKGHTEEVTSVAVSPDGTRIASGSEDCTIRVWDARMGEEVTKPLTGHTDRVNSVAFSPDGTLIASGSDDETIRIWDARTAEEVVGALTGHDDSVQSVVFSPDGTRVVSGSSDWTIRVCDVSTGTEVMEPLAGHTSTITSVAISPDRTCIASGSRDGTVRVWDMATGKEVTEPLKGHDDWVLSVAFSLDGSKIISGSADGTIRLWDAKTGEPRAEPLEGNTGRVNSVAFAPNGIYIASGSDDQSIRMWDTRTSQEAINPLTGHTDRVTSVAFSTDGTQIISGSADGTIRVWDARMDGEAIKPLPGHTDSVNSVAFSPDRSRVASGSSDRTIRIWDSRTGKQVVKPLTGHEGDIWSVAFSPDGTQLASGSADKTVRLWDAGTGEEVTKPMTGHTDTVYSVAFSSDGSQIASGSRDRTIRLWNAATGEEVGEPLTGHADWVRSVTFSLNGSHIASGSDDGTIRLWDARTGKEVIAPLTGHSSWVQSVAFSPDGTRIASGSTDGTVRIFDATIADPDGSCSRRELDPHRQVLDSPPSLKTGAYTHSRASEHDPSSLPIQSPWYTHLADVRHLHEGSDVQNPRDVLSFDDYTGWIKGQRGKLILWIPPEYRKCLYGPRNTLVIGTGAVSLDMRRYVHGPNWIQCYTPITSSITS